MEDFYWIEIGKPFNVPHEDGSAYNCEVGQIFKFKKPKKENSSLTLIYEDCKMCKGEECIGHKAHIYESFMSINPSFFLDITKKVIRNNKIEKILED
jgi:hypothetical protein